MPLGLSSSAGADVALSVSHQCGTMECNIWRAGVFVLFSCLGLHGGFCVCNLVANERLDLLVSRRTYLEVGVAWGTCDCEVLVLILR